MFPARRNPRSSLCIAARQIPPEKASPSHNARGAFNNRCHAASKPAQFPARSHGRRGEYASFPDQAVDTGIWEPFSPVPYHGLGEKILSGASSKPALGVWICASPRQQMLRCQRHPAAGRGLPDHFRAWTTLSTLQNSQCTMRQAGTNVDKAPPICLWLNRTRGSSMRADASCCQSRGCF